MQNVEDIYPLTSMQELMLLRLLAGGDAKALKEIARYTLRGELDVPLYQRAWQAVIDRHPILRTAFLADGLKKPLQVVRQEATPEWTVEDWRHLDADQQASALQAFLDADQRRGFDPAQAPLMRFAILRMADDRSELVQSLHHMLMDRWSGTQVMNEAMLLYEAWRRDEEVALPPARPFRDYVRWLEAQDRAESEAHWTETLAGFERPTPLPFGRPDDATTIDVGAIELRQIELDAEITAALQSWSREQRVTLNTVVSGAWGITLGHASASDDVVFGVTVSGRPADLEGVEEIVGLFINNLPVRIRIDPDAEAGAWLRQVQSEHSRARRYEHSSLALVQEWSAVPAGQPLFDSLYVFQNPVRDDQRTGDAAHRSSVEIVNTWGEMRTGYPLTLVVYPQNNLTLRLSYDPALFPVATINSLLDDLRRVLEGLTSAPGVTPRELRAPLLTVGSTNAPDRATRTPASPASTAVNGARAPGLIAPRTQAERAIAQVWCDVLGIEQVGVQDNFFDVGGTSMLAIRSITRLEKEHGIRLSAAALMFQTLGQVGAIAETQSGAASGRSGGVRGLGGELLRRILPKRGGRG